MAPPDILERDDLFGDDDAAGPRIQSFKEEMASMPFLPRLTIYLSLACMVLLFIQCIFIMPVILIKYGWGYAGGFVK
jgi:hypothetical protein